MTPKIRLQSLFLIVFFTCFSVASFAQCLQIETIFVDACADSSPESFNEMVRFKTGATPVNVGVINVSWPILPWQGLLQNSFTASKVASLNAQIDLLGGCGDFIEPILGVIPANTKVILITSHNFSLTANAFGALTEDVYILFQNNPTDVGGHFANYSAASGIRTLTISFGACSDTVSYDKSLLVDTNGLPGSSNGATVNFNAAGVATYTNIGCVVPIDVFAVEAGNTVSACPGATITLAATAQGQASVLWSALSGSFSNNGALNSTYTLPFTASGSVVLTITATNPCGNSIQDTVNITVNPTTAPNFSSTLAFCSGSVAPILNTTSPNGITGVWSPTTISNTVGNNYTFTPNSGQCATSFVTTVTVNSSTTPDFAPTLTLCSGNVAPILNTTSPNGIVGTWSPATINNTVGGNYIFTPNAGQCASNFTTVVTVTSANIIPDFAPTLTLCAGNVAPILNTTSPNGIVGTWSPATINNTVGGNYLFTPNAGQCASNFTTVVTVTSANIIPDFAPTLTLCAGNVAPILNTTSPSGIVGTWSPATINNTVGGNYIFTPNAGQCASNFTTVVTVTSANIIPDFAPTLTLCAGNVAPILNATSPNGIVGTWSPATINNTVGGNYIFTPNTGQCASNLTTVVTVTSANIIPDFAPTLTLCAGNVAPILNTTSPNGIVGTWSPATINNTVGGNYIFTPNAGQCAVNTQLIITVNAPSIVPVFATTTLTICDGDALIPLPTTSINGIIGAWSPALDNTQTKTYSFIPNPGQCAVGTTFTINVTPKTIPTFNAVNATCVGGLLSPLPTISLNAITGTWSPALDNTQTRTYTFTPNPNQCATAASLTITITVAITPLFNPIAPVCEGTSVDPLPTTSLNGIIGTWSPIFDNTVSQLYTFTPNAGQCATSGSLNIAVAPNPILFETGYICFDASGQLATPATIDTRLSSVDYTFVWTQDGNPIPVPNSSASYQATQAGIYKVTATNILTNCTITLVTTVEVSPAATAIAYVNEDFAEVQQIIVKVTGGLGNFMYQLNNGPWQPSNIFMITQGGDYTIHVEDLNGCNTFELEVTALNYPKFFTPNGDGYNDSWNVAGLLPSQNGIITIFDRYGKLLKQISANGEGWNGNYNGSTLAATDYWFVISYESLSGISKSFRAHFSLKR